MKYLAHVEEWREQYLWEHLRGTAARAAAFASAFGAEKLGNRCGLLHDIGKYSEKFQRRIRGSGERVDHSTAGAFEAYKLGDVPSAFSIAGHHAGLPDLGNNKYNNSDSPTFWGRMKRGTCAEIENYGAFRDEIIIPEASVPSQFRSDGLNAFFFTKMLYSCLVDADFLDTEAFVSGGAVRRGGYDELSVLWDRLQGKIAPWRDAKTELNRRRCEILRTLIEKADGEKGLFTLTVPTGGGKTISSVAFALRHALRNQMCRVIYVIPYTSIIEQTQQVFEGIRR